MTDTYALLIITLLFALLLVMWQRANDEFDLRHLIIDESGRASLFKIGQLVALIVSTWVIVHETRRGVLTEWLFLTYAGLWSGMNIMNKVADKYKALEPPKEGPK